MTEHAYYRWCKEYGVRQHYNTFRPHSSLDYKSPTPKVILPAHYVSPYLEYVAAGAD